MATTNKQMNEWAESWKKLDTEIKALEEDIKKMKRSRDEFKNKFIDELGDKGERNTGEYICKTWNSTKYLADSKILKQMMTEDPDTYNKVGGHPVVSNFCSVAKA